MKKKNPMSENATKGDLLILRSELKNELNDLKHEVDDKARKYRDEILTSNDKLAMQLETTREELGLGNLQMKREIEDHEKRIKHLENV